MRIATTYLMVLCTICVALAQFSFKFSINNSRYIFILLGIFLYAIGTVFFLIALKNEQVSKVYPYMSLVFIWVLILSTSHLNETLTTSKVIGVISILIGVILIGRLQ